MPQRTRPPLSFEATRAFTNPMGEVLGAFQAAMLYDTMGPALLARIGPLLATAIAVARVIPAKLG